MDKQEIIDMLTHFYELDLGNCMMTHKDWVNELAKALTDSEYLNKLKVEYDSYLETINA